MVLHEGN